MTTKKNKTTSKSTSKSDSMFTLAHVTHEAVEQIGGIGTVLEGLMISPEYQKRVKRSILIGPMMGHDQVDPQSRLGEHGTVLYSSVDNIDELGLADKFRPIEWAFNVAIVYGKRTYDQPSQNRKGEAEVILIDVFRVNKDRLNVFKHRLWETFGLNSSLYENAWDYEEYTRLAEPAYYALRSLLTDDDLPCTLFSHEFMGMPAALKAIMDGGENFRTVYHAHECPTARRIVEDHEGHDSMFYSVMDCARKMNLYVEDIFGPLDHNLRHALASRAHLCDGIIAVGDRTRDELKFLNHHFDDKPVTLVYNGLPTHKTTLKIRNHARKQLAAYAATLVGFTPDVLMTHVTRPVISKALWRDLQVCDELDSRLGAQNKKGVLFILTSAGGVRRPQDINSMVKHYGWPRHHRHDYPDLVGPEIDLNNDIHSFNETHANIQVILVNQFGWDAKRLGPNLPADMDFASLRSATDVEFGMAVYEPFGISPLEPLACGAICVISNVCGCEGFVRHATGSKATPNVLVGDYTEHNGNQSLEHFRQIGQHQRDAIEKRIAVELADALIKNLPNNDKERQALIRSGQALVKKMGWDQVVIEGLAPLLEDIQ